MAEENPDLWDSYTANRKRIQDGWQASGNTSTIVLTGDVHRHWAANVMNDYCCDHIREPGWPAGSDVMKAGQQVPGWHGHRPSAQDPRQHGDRGQAAQPALAVDPVGAITMTYADDNDGDTFDDILIGTGLTNST